MAELTGIIYIGEDPVSGKNRYYNLDTNLSSLSDTAPTADQLARYKEEEARQARQEVAQEKPPSRSTADTIEKQAKVTAIANGYVSKSNDVIGTAEVVVNRATPVESNAGLRLGDAYTTPEKSLANASNKSALITQKVAIDKQIIANKDFLTKYAQSSDPAINTARQQVQTSTLQLQTTYAKINETLATIDGASTQILSTSAPAAPTQDTAQRDVVNNTSPATVAAGTSKLPTNQLSNLKKLAGSNTNLGVVPAVSDKIEPAVTGVNSVGNKFIAGVQPSTQTPTADPDAVDLSKVLPNTLLQYSSYTYGLSLHLLTDKEYNKIVQKGEFVPNRVLIASAGRYNNTPGPNQFIRSPRFNEDFYFDNFELTTVIGLNAQSRNSNSIHYRFTLIEPYGFTLIDKIIGTCEDLGIENYLDMPYLLQIDFFGIDDAGQIVGIIPDTTKRIPIRLNKMEVGITAKGAEYSIEGTPYNHSAFDLSTITTPANFEVEAGSVAQFFQSNETAGDTTDTSAQRESAQSTLWASTDGRLVGPDGQFTNQGQINSSLLSIQTKRELGLIQSYGTALNNFQKSLVIDEKIEFADSYFFNFVDPALANSLFTSLALSTPKDTGMTAVNLPSSASNVNSIKKSDLGFNTNSYNPNRRIFQINAGTHIDRVISWVVRNSEWMTKQLEGIVPEEVGNSQNAIDEYIANLKKDKPLKWIKVVPSIELGSFDRTRKIWSRKITYNIQTYEVRNVKVDVAPQGSAKNPVKSYNYLYTGKNDDIIDVEIKFNALYYNALTIRRNAINNINPVASISELNKIKNSAAYHGADQKANAIMPLVMKPVVLDARNRASGSSNTTRQVAVADIEESLMTMSQADMINVKLTILGDPGFIKQDDVFWTPKSNAQVSENKTNADTRLTPDGSLKMDNGEVYVQLLFRTPSDIDESTGAMKFASTADNLKNTNISLFSGMYQVISIVNNFRSGQFTQVLNLVRLFKQGKLDYSSNKVPTSDNRNILLGQTVPMNDYMQGPNFITSDAPKISSAVDDAAQSAQQQQDNGDNQPPADVNQAEQNLRDINTNAVEQPITAQTEPVEVVPNFTPIRVQGNQVPGQAAVQ